MDFEFLKQQGLTENEAKIYLALLELGPSLAGQISRKTGLHRRTIYDTTVRLAKKGLIGYILENNKKLFSAASPERFLEILNEKQKIINQNMDNMLSLFQITKEKQETNFFKGKEGLKTVFEDQIK